MSSLASAWSSMKINDEKAINEQCLDLDEVHRAARVFYASLNPTAQREANELFDHLDKDKNGSVTKEELAHLLNGSRAASHLNYLFGLLDTDKNGELSFEECITLYYIIQARPECDHCGKPLVGLFYVCATCWDCNNGAYNLCYKCFTSKIYIHTHQEFLDNYLAFKRLLSLAVKPNKIQCTVCGDIHDVNVPSFFPNGQHLTRRDDGLGHVCEWCLKRICSSCGGVFSSQQSDARPRQWLMNNFYCKRCGKPGNSTDKSALSQRFKRRCFDGSTPQCENCYFKIKKDEMFLSLRTQREASKSMSNNFVVAPDKKINNSNNTLPVPSQKGMGGFDILDIAQMAFNVVQNSKSQSSQEVSQAPQCKVM